MLTVYADLDCDSWVDVLQSCAVVDCTTQHPAVSKKLHSSSEPRFGGVRSTAQHDPYPPTGRSKKDSPRAAVHGKYKHLFSSSVSQAVLLFLRALSRGGNLSWLPLPGRDAKVPNLLLYALLISQSNQILPITP